MTSAVVPPFLPQEPGSQVSFFVLTASSNYLHVLRRITSRLSLQSVLTLTHQQGPQHASNVTVLVRSGCARIGRGFLIAVAAFLPAAANRNKLPAAAQAGWKTQRERERESAGVARACAGGTWGLRVSAYEGARRHFPWTRARLGALKDS